MSSSAFDVVRITTGIRFRSGSAFISASTSRPSLMGRLRSSKIKSGRGLFLNLPRRRRHIKASWPSLATIKLLCTLLSVSTSSVRRTSATLSSTSKISMGCGVDSKFIVGLLLGFIAASIGDAESERGAATWSGLQPNAAAVPLGNFFADGQADAGAGVLRLGMQALKNHEDALAMLGSYANAIVTHGNIPAACGSLGTNVNSCGLIPPEFDRVANEVLQDLAKLQFVCQHYGQRISSDDGAALFDAALEIFQNGVENSVSRDQESSLGADAGKCEQIVDEGLHAL